VARIIKSSSLSLPLPLPLPLLVLLEYTSSSSIEGGLVLLLRCICPSSPFNS
jgi:hypothetical protein